MIIMGPNFTKFAGARAAIMLEALTKGKNKVKLILNWRYQGPRLPFFFVKNKHGNPPSYNSGKFRPVRFCFWNFRSLDNNRRNMPR